LLAHGTWAKRLAGKRGSTAYTTPSTFCFKNVDSEWSYDYTPSKVNVSEIGIMLPGHSAVSIAAIMPH
jgi:hypothetical protein